MQRVKSGDLVSVEYVGTINNDEIFESTLDTGPLEFEVGCGSVLPAFEQAVLNMAINEKNEITIPAGEAYGESIADLIHTMDQDSFGKDHELNPGMILNLDFEHEGQTQKVPALVTKIEDGQVTLDFNHPLAGKTLSYAITVTDIKNKE